MITDATRVEQLVGGASDSIATLEYVQPAGEPWTITVDVPRESALEPVRQWLPDDSSVTPCDEGAMATLTGTGDFLDFLTAATMLSDVEKGSNIGFSADKYVLDDLDTMANILATDSPLTRKFVVYYSSRASFRENTGERVVFTNKGFWYTPFGATVKHTLNSAERGVHLLTLNTDNQVVRMQTIEEVRADVHKD